MSTVTTEAQLCNLALGMVGQRQLITSLTEESTEAQLCAAFYPTARDMLLSSRAWRFTTRRTVLALTQETRTLWEYAYTAPPRLLMAHEIVSGMRPTPPGGQVPFDIELNDAGDALLILTDMQDAELVYSSKVTNVALYPAPFVMAVAARLAVFLALSLPVKPALAQWFEGQAEKHRQAAAAHDLNTVQPSPQPAAEVIRERA